MLASMEQPISSPPQSLGGGPSLEEGHASDSKLKEKMLRVANLVAADATRQSSPRALAKACGLTDTPPSCPAPAPYDDEGETYLLIRQAFGAAFDELIQQMQGSRQGIVEDLWAAVADYIDRMHARSDVAFNDATVQFAITSELERQLRLANARYKEVQHELNHVKAQLGQLQQAGSKAGPEEAEQAQPSMLVGEAMQEQTPMQVPQPVEDRSSIGLIGHQAPLTPCGGEASGPVSSAEARRSQRSAALIRLAHEGLMVDTSLPQMMSLGLAGASTDAVGPQEAAHVSAQQQSAWEEARAEAVQQGILKDERERMLARQRGIMHQLEEQLASMRRRTACIDSPIGGGSDHGDLAAAAASAGQEFPTTDSSAAQGTPPQGRFGMRAVPAAELDVGPKQQPAMQGTGLAAHRPMSVAQKAGMKVWSRHGLKHGRGLLQARHGNSSVPGPEDVPLTCASSGPLAQGVAAAAAHRASTPEGHRSSASARRPRHMMLSSSADTALGDVLTVQSTPTVGIPSMEQQGFLSFMRSPQAGADSTSRLSQTEEANAGMLARSAARLPLHPEQIALALAEQPSAQPLVSCDILQSPLVSPAEDYRSRTADVSRPARAFQRSPADVSMTAPAGMPAHRPAPLQHQTLYSPGGAPSPMQHARASIQQWGKPRGFPAESMVICGPTWSFPVEAGSPAGPSRASSRECPAAQRPTNFRSPAIATEGQTQEHPGSSTMMQSPAGNKGKMRAPNQALEPEESSISFRCRQVTASLPDMAALAAAIRGQPKPQQQQPNEAQRAESRLLPELATTERARRLQAVQAAAEEASASCAPAVQAHDHASNSAAWPLKKGAWDRIQQSAKSVKPDRWLVNEVAAVSESADLQAALTVQPKKTAFEDAADAVLAAIAKDAALPSNSDVVSKQAAASSIPAPNAQLKDAIVAKAARNAQASAQPSRLPPAGAAKASGKPTVAQKLLAKANCFAAFALSPAKEAAPSAPGPSTNHFAVTLATASAAASTSKESASKATSPQGKVAAVSSPAQELKESTVAQAAQMEAELAVSSPESRSPPQQKARASAKGGVIGTPTSQSISSVAAESATITLSENSFVASPASKGAASVRSSKTVASTQVLLQKLKSLGSTEADNAADGSQGKSSGFILPTKAAAAAADLQATLSASKQASPAPALMQSTPIKSPAGAAQRLARKSLSPAVQNSTSPPKAAEISSPEVLQTPETKKSPQSKSPWSVQAPPSFDIHVACQSSRVTLASASVSPGLAQQQQQQSLWPAQKLFANLPSKSAASPQSQQEHPTPAAASTPGQKSLHSSPEKHPGIDPLEMYSASVGSARKTAEAAAEKLACLPPSPQEPHAETEGSSRAATDSEMAADGSRSVSEIEFSSDSEPDEGHSSSVLGHSHTEDSEWGGSTSLLSTGNQAAQAEAADVKSTEIAAQASEEEEMYTAHTEVLLSEDAEASLPGMEDEALAVQVETTISESTEVLMETASDVRLQEGDTEPELEVTCAQVITSASTASGQAGSAAEDRELESMLAAALGSLPGQLSTQCAQNSEQVVSAAEALPAQQAAESDHKGSSAAGADAETAAVHLPDDLLESPMAVASQSIKPFAAGQAQEADSDEDDGGTFTRKPMKKNRKGRRAGKK